MKLSYVQQVSLLLRLLPEVLKIESFALHGGTAINLFHHNMPRLSVDIDITYIPFGPRATDLEQIQLRLIEIAKRLVAIIPGIVVSPPSLQKEEYKLFCQLGESIVKIEVNTINRGIMAPVELMPLSILAQDTFNHFVEARIVPKSQLFGGKMIAALDRQHPRDIFDMHQFLLKKEQIKDIKSGLLFCLLSSNRPIHELLAPNFLDQRQAFVNQFDGMSDSPFTYKQFEEIRSLLVIEVKNLLSAQDKSFLIDFMLGNTNDTDYQFLNYPAIAWKRKNIDLLKKNNPAKFKKLMKQTALSFEI